VTSWTWTVSEIDLLDRFGAQTIGPGETQSTARFTWDSTRQISAVWYTIRYEIAGALFSESINISCP
jgi:hypothetical protein